MARCRFTAILCPLLIAFATSARAQIGGSAAPAASGPQPALVPLSGRTTQPGSATTAQTPAPGPTTGVNVLNASVQVQGALSGSTAGAAGRPFSGALSLREAVARGLEHNLGAVNLSSLVRQARGQQSQARAALLPNAVGDVTATLQEINLAALGFSAPIPGFAFPTVVGPFNTFDVRARLSQTVLDMTALNNFRAAGATVRADELSVDDTRDLIVLAVGGTYLQVVTAAARVDSARAQLDTATALFQQTSERRAVGLVAQVDVARSQVQQLSNRQRVISLQNELAKQKINLARMIGLPPNDQYTLSDAVPFADAPAFTVDEALRKAHDERADLKAAAEHVTAAERALAAARATRLPSVQVNADLGAIGNTPDNARRTFSLVGSLRVPLWQGGRAEAEIQQAEAALTERRAEREDLAAQVESEVRKAYLDVQAVTAQVDVTDESRQVARQALDLTRQRFDAGVSDNLEVVQAQEALASAELDYINSIYAHNLAKLTLARAIGQAADRVADFLKIP